MSNTNDIIRNLHLRPFSTLNFCEKQEIVKSDRPKPVLKYLKTVIKKSGVVRTFNTDLYDNHIWLCGSESFNKLYCWPCLLFSNEKSTWNSTDKGFCDLNNIHTAVSRHEKSESHINAWIKFKSFGTSRIETQIDTLFKIEIERHNEKVRQNREILKRFISITCFLAKQEIAFRGHNEAKDSVNRGNYIELAKTLAEYDEKLNNHLQNATVFSGLSASIQNDLVNSITNVMINTIKDELSQVKFVAISLDETSDVTNFSQMSTVFRYVYGGRCVERFICFTDVSKDRSATAIYDHVLRYLNLFDCKDKLIAQTYDGASVMAGHLNGVQTKVREVIPEAVFVHCYSHKLNLVLSQSTSLIKQCKIFFSTLSGLVAFFSHSSKRTSLLDSVVKRRFPKIAPTRWSYNSRLVQSVQDCKEPLITMFTEIIENADIWDGKTILEARGFLSILQDFEFNFLLNLFNEIYTHTEVTFQILQSKHLDITFCSKEIIALQNFLQEMRNSQFENIWGSTAGSKNENINTSKRKRYEMSPEETYKHLFYEILDTISRQITVRFESLKHELKFIELLDSTKYVQYSTCFPTESLNALKDIYAKFFDFPRLKCELSVFYKSESLPHTSVLNVFKHLEQNDLHVGLPELFKLCNLILTIPVTSSSVERSFSALKRIKTYTRNSQGEDRLSGLALMSIEKELLTSLKAKETFFDIVIKDFCRKTRRMDLLYK